MDGPRRSLRNVRKSSNQPIAKIQTRKKTRASSASAKNRTENDAMAAVPPAEGANNEFDSFINDILFEAHDTTSDDRIMEEVDILLAEIREGDNARNAVLNGIAPHASQSSDSSNDTVIFEAVTATATGHPNAEHARNERDNQNTQGLARAGPNPGNNSSVIVINDETSYDDEVVFVSDSKTNIPVVNLCSPESSATRERLERAPPTKPAMDDSLNDSMVGGMRCPICMDPVKAKTPYSTICGHIFCCECIQRCVRLTKKCPMCTQKLGPKGIHQIYF